MPVLPQFIKIMRRSCGNGRPPSSLVHGYLSPRERVKRSRSFGLNREKNGIRKTTETFTDVEYHELMCTNNSDHADLDAIAPFLRVPGDAIIAVPKPTRLGTTSRMGQNTL
jgi:hypothetical protein